MKNRNRTGQVLMVVIMLIIGCKQPEGLKYIGIQHFRIRSVNLEQSVIATDLIFYNPNNFRMKLKSADIDVMVNNNYLGHCRLDTLMGIPKRDTFLLPVQMQVKMKSLITNSLDALLSNEFDVSLKGNARLGKGGVYINFPFTYHGKQEIKIF